MWGETRLRWLALLGLVLVVSACGGEEPPAPDGLLIGPAHQAVAIAPGGTVPVHVQLQRTGTLTGAILVTGSAGPAGVTAQPLVLTSEESEGDLLFQANELVEIGARGRVLLLAQSGSEAYSATVDVEIIAPVAVEIASAPAKVMQTGSSQVKVNIQRTGGFAGPVRLILQGPPAGITVANRELTLERGVTSASFTVRTSYLTPVAKTPLTFTATVGRFAASATTQLDVTRVSGLWDESFGAGGWAELPVNHVISSLLVQPDGRLVLGAGTYNSNLWIHRRELDGQPDTTFGQAGVVELPNPTGTSSHDPPKLVLQPDGKLLVFTDSGYEVYLYRLNPDGSRDSTFGSGGQVTLVLSSYSGYGYTYETELALLPDGALLLAARESTYLTCLRLTPQGQKDGTYGTSGRVTLPAPDLHDVYSPMGVFVDAQERAVIATGYRASDGSAGGIRAFRVTREGVADTSFGAEGQRAYPLSPEFNAQGFSRVGDGFVVLGRVAKDFQSSGEQWLVRLGPHGDTLEQQWKSVAFPATTSTGSITTLSDGRILAALSVGVIRLLPTGAVDPSFPTQPYHGDRVFPGQADAVYFSAAWNFRRMLPPQ